ncbi:MAG: hypothetical protein HC821_05105 [Lewinella sp.]|nr:hypothetical protein [Lewinella sp.]
MPLYLVRTFDTGHQNYVGNEFNNWFHKDKHYALELLGSGARMSYLLGFFELIVFAFILYFGALSQVVGVDIGTPYGPISIGILVFLVRWWLLGSLGGILVKVLLADGYFKQTVYLGLLQKGFEIVVLLLGALLKWTILEVCIYFSLAELLSSLIVYAFFWQKMPEFFYWWKSGSWRLGWKNFMLSLALTYHSVLEQFNSNGTIVLISNFISAATVPIFTTIRTITNTVTQLTNLILNPLTPELIRYHSKTEGSKITDVMAANWLVSGLLVNLPLLALTPAVGYLYQLWTQQQLEFDTKLFAWLAVGVTLGNFGRSFCVYLTGINHLKSIFLMSSVRFALVFSLSFYLLPSLGLSGLGLAIMLGEIFSSVFIPWYFTASELAKMAVKINSRSWQLALFSTLSTVVALLASIYFPQYLIFFISFSVGVVVLSAFLQWRYLPASVKEKISFQRFT